METKIELRKVNRGWILNLNGHEAVYSESESLQLVHALRSQIEEPAQQLISGLEGVESLTVNISAVVPKPA